MVIGEGQRPSRLQGFCHILENGGQTLAKVVQTPVHRDVAGQFVGIACRAELKYRVFRTDQLPNPDITEIHQLGVLDVAEIGGIGEDAVQAVVGQIRIRCAPAEKMDAPGFRGQIAVSPVADPFIRDGCQDFSAPFMAGLEGVIAVGLCFHVFLQDVRPTAAPNARAAAVGDAEEVGFTLDQPDGKTVDGEDVEGFEGHRVVPAKHVLVAQEIRKVCDECVSDPFILLRGNGPATQFQTQQLAVIEHLPVFLVPPAKETVSFVAGQDFVVGDMGCPDLFKQRGSPGVIEQGVFIRPLEETTLVGRLAVAAMIFDGEHAVTGRACCRVGIGIDLPASGAGAFVSFCRSCEGYFAAAGLADTRMGSVFDAVQVAAGGADENILRMPPVFGQQVAGKQVEVMTAMAAGLIFHPEEILDVSFRGAAFQTLGAVEGADLRLQTTGKIFR